MLEVQGLKKAYGSRSVLKGVDFRLAPGEIAALIGPNGAGKTTLISILSGLLPADEGRVVLEGNVLGKRWSLEQRQSIGCAPQEIGVYPTLSARQNLDFFGRLYGLSKKERSARVERLVHEFDLESCVEQKSAELSGGQKRRLHSAIALLHQPKVLFLDEATVGADVDARRRLLEAVKSYAAEGCAVLYTTHYLAEIEVLGASIAILEGGVISHRDSLQRTVSQHGTSQAVLEFEGDAPAFADWVVSGNRLVSNSHEPAGAVALALSQLGEARRRLRQVFIRQPDLESAYLSITGHSTEVEA